MGCTRFGERWDQGVDDLLTDAAKDAIASAGVAVGRHRRLLARHDGLGCGRASRCPSRSSSTTSPSPALENFCATGSEAFRNACYAVASGAYDLAMAIGVEKLKDSGFSGLAGIRPVGDGTDAALTAPASFSFLAPAYCHKYGVDEAEMKDVLTRIAWKNHRNGAVNPRAQFRKEVSKETIAASPLVAGQLGVFDCSGVSDGSAAAIICRAEDAHRYTRPPAVREGAAASWPGRRAGPIDPELRLHHLPGGRPLGGGRLPAGRDHRPAGRAGHGRGPRLLHARRSWC